MAVEAIEGWRRALSSAPARTQTHVAVGVCTYRRPEQLRRLLESLAVLEYPRERVHIVVIDHDPEQSARPIVESLMTHVADLRYETESIRLISAARNHLASSALATGAPYVVFVDDDEWVSKGWLGELVAAAHQLSADAIAGPVLPVYEAGVSQWVIDGGFFMRERFATGRRVGGHGIGNVLVRSEWLARIKPPFGERFRTRGEDTYFLMELERAGARTYWCDEAALHEWVPRERAAGAWLIRRAFAMGSAYSECLICAGLGTAGYADRVAKCVLRMTQGVVCLPWAVVRGRAAVIATVAHVAAGAGGLHGLMLKKRATRE